MLHGRDGALNDENIRAGFLRDRAESLGLLRNGADGGEHARFLQFLNARGDQVFLDRLEVDLLDSAVTSALSASTIFSRTSGGFFVARLHAFEIDHTEAAQLAHLDGETHIGHAIHRAGERSGFSA